MKLWYCMNTRSKTLTFVQEERTAMASIVRYQPLRFPLNGVTRELDRIVDRLLDDTAALPRANGRGPLSTTANLYETSEAYWVELPLPGVKPEDVELTVQENVLSLKAKRAWRTPEQSRVVWQGFGQGEWQQTFTLPGEVDNTRVAATLEHGILRLELPKAEHAKPRTIRVNTSAVAPAAESNTLSDAAQAS